MLGSRQENARLQSDFYRDQFRKILRWIIGTVVIIYLLMASIIYLILHKVPQSYFANTTSGRILDMPQQVE